MKNILITVFCILILFPTLAQRDNNSVLNRLRDSLDLVSQLRAERIKEYLDQNGGSRVFTKNSVTYLLKDVNDRGRPILFKTDNLGAANTTGANKLQPGGLSGLDLDGSGVKLGIWDGGAVRQTHQEFGGNRILPTDGSPDNNFHATHVAGTVLAAGINSSAKGMAVNAVARTFDFQDDEEEMAEWISSDQSGLILSNHSYGLVTGWDDGTWYGDDEISSAEDWRFGFYTGGARLWDEYAFNSPYYSIIKSAGNDRGDAGDGTHPPDGPYDIISSHATAKNIFTIGAVSKISEYTGPESVVMSSFSSWGPTDDGRIKPDFVAAGVSIFSTLEKSNDDYGTLSGTSMSTPNTTGSLALLQQLYAKLNGGNYMKSSLLKALTIHTIKEAGIADGPDYKFGWGLLDVYEAASFLLENGAPGRIVVPIELNEGTTFNYEFTPKENTKVTATIAWIDPPGQVLPASIDPKDLMLVNDLDMNVSQSGEIKYPWILNPDATGATATTGDNYRDNIEKIEYFGDGTTNTLTISHKNSLADGSQEVFLVLSFTPDNNPGIYYWTGAEDNDWTNSNNWNVNNEVIADQIPVDGSSIVFDGNSFSGTTTDTLRLAANTKLSSLVFASNSKAVIDLSGHDLIIQGQINLNDNLTFFGNGRVVMEGGVTAGPSQINLASSAKNIIVQFNDPNSRWLLGKETTIGRLELISGSVQANNSILECKTVILSDNSDVKLLLENSVVKVDSVIQIPSNAELEDLGAVYQMGEYSRAVIDRETNGDLELLKGELILEGNGEVQGLRNGSIIQVNSDFRITNLTLDGNSITVLSNGVRMSLGNIVSTGSKETPATIRSDAGAEIELIERKKICMDENLKVDHVNLIGAGVVSIGANSSITNSEGWHQSLCDDVLFADFRVNYNCEGSLVYFENLSTGKLSEVIWDLGGGIVFSDTSIWYRFENVGLKEVKLLISNGTESDSIIQQFEISQNPIVEENHIIANSTALISFNSADVFQWFRNGEELIGATERTYVHNNVPGEYMVATFRDGCNAVSTGYRIEEPLGALENTVLVFPNPVGDRLYIQAHDLIYVEMFTLAGQLLSSKVTYSKNNASIDVSELISGVYLVRIESEGSSLIKRVIIK